MILGHGTELGLQIIVWLGIQDQQQLHCCHLWPKGKKLFPEKQNLQELTCRAIITKDRPWVENQIKVMSHEGAYEKKIYKNLLPLLSQISTMLHWLFPQKHQTEPTDMSANFSKPWGETINRREPKQTPKWHVTELHETCI